MKHNRLSFRSLLNISSRLSLRGRLPTKIITVILSAFSFTLFAVGSMGLTYSETDWMARAYLNYNAENGYIAYAPSGGKELMRTSQLRELEEIVGSDAAYELDQRYTDTDLSLNHEWRRFVADDGRSEIGEADFYDYFSSVPGYPAARTVSLAASEEAYRSIGFTLLAGSYPAAEDEIAISEAHFMSFQKRGYVNAASAYVWQGANGFSYDSTREVTERETISSYEDILYKTLGMGDPEEEENAFSYTIVGVVDTHFDAAHAGEYYRPMGALMYSEQHREGADAVYAAYGKQTDRGTMKKIAAKLLDWAQQPQDQTFGFPEPYRMIYRSWAQQLIDQTDGLVVERDAMVVLGGAGIFFGIFAALLNGYLTTRSIETKEKKVGILRSMGASTREVFLIVFAEVVLLATCIFLLALAASLGIYFGWLRGFSQFEAFGVSSFVYNGWTVLILAAFSYGVPLLCSVLPLRKFFRRSIMECISGSGGKSSPHHIKKRARAHV